MPRVFFGGACTVTLCHTVIVRHTNYRCSLLRVYSNAMPTTHETPQKSRFPSWATSFGHQIIASLILGIALGYVALALGGDAKNNPNWLMATLDAVGTSYVTLLKAAVIPLVFTAVVASISNLSQVTNAAHRYGTEVVLSYEDQS